MSRSVFVHYEGVFEEVAHRERLGTLGFDGGRWALRCWGSGVVIGGGVQSAHFELSARSRRSTTVQIHSLDGRYDAELTVLTGRGRLLRQIRSSEASAEEASARRELLRHGDWWLDPRPFAELGPGAAVSVGDTRYLGGWQGPVRFEGRSGGRILDLDRNGITLRGMRRHLLIPWDSVNGITIEGSPVALRVMTGTGDVRFESRQASVDDLRQRLAPLTRRIEARCRQL